MSVYQVQAKHWEQGWELHVAGVGVTQVRLLANAERQARDLIATYGNEDAYTAAVHVAVELAGLEAKAEAAKAATAAAAKAQKEAAENARQVVADLRDAGLSVSDIATVMGVSRGRVSQLTDA